MARLRAGEPESSSGDPASDLGVLCPAGFSNPRQLAESTAPRPPSAENKRAFPAVATRAALGPQQVPGAPRGQSPTAVHLSPTRTTPVLLQGQVLRANGNGCGDKEGQGPGLCALLPPLQPQGRNPSRGAGDGRDASPAAPTPQTGPLCSPGKPESHACVRVRVCGQGCTRANYERTGRGHVLTIPGEAAEPLREAEERVGGRERRAWGPLHTDTPRRGSEGPQVSRRVPGPSATPYQLSDPGRAASDAPHLQRGRSVTRMSPAAVKPKCATSAQCSGRSLGRDKGSTAGRDLGISLSRLRCRTAAR